jgi:phosphoribosyl 1,2-cyclic phosphodiesterase
MRLYVCGVRGSTPSPGADFVRYGGNTSCIAVARDGEDPHLVLDAGTGLRQLTKFMNRRPFNGTILIGHLHWDHTHGLPFFRSGDQPTSSVHVLIPDEGEPHEMMARVHSPPHFPVRIEELYGSWTLDNLQPGTQTIEGYEVTTLDIPHKNARTYGFRISDGSKSIAYLSDHWPTSVGPGADGYGEYHENALALAHNVDLLIHDAQYTEEEFKTRSEFGHCVIDYPIGLGKKAGARMVMLYHHDPERTDDQLDQIMASVKSDSGPDIIAAVEGTTVDL